MFWTDFEPFTAKDSVSIQYTLMFLISSDWFFEITRERLLEVYTKDQVDKLIPYSKEHMFDFANQLTITDEELQRIGLYEDKAKIYEMPEDLIHKPHSDLKEKIHFEKSKESNKDFKYG